MNILFLTLVKIHKITDSTIYMEMARTLSDYGHHVYGVSPLEKRDRLGNYIEAEGNIQLMHVNIGGNYFHANSIEKGITLIGLERKYIDNVRRAYRDVKFDLVLYATPPITLGKVVDFIKKRDSAKTYLLLKDIFPQNAVDMGMMSKRGIKCGIYKYFRDKEKKLYAVSDYIGCMSKANMDYVLSNNREVSRSKVEMLPNCTQIRDQSVTVGQREAVRKKYRIPIEKKVFVYGGNLGKPQGIDYIIKCLKQSRDEDVLFLIVGDGTDYHRLYEYCKKEKLPNVKMMKRLPKEDYEQMVGACDVGLIFLDHRFTIPNFPSRLLSYMKAKIPVLACTDPCTDIGEVIREGRFGWWCESNHPKEFQKLVRVAMNSNLTELGENGFRYLQEHYDVEDAVAKILKHV